MQITDEEVLHIANLARLKLEEKEIQDYKKNLQEILDYADIINNVDTSKVDETIGINEKYNVFRKDEIVEPLSREDLLANAPSQEDGMFHIPKVIDID